MSLGQENVSRVVTRVRDSLSITKREAGSSLVVKLLELLSLLIGSTSYSPSKGHNYMRHPLGPVLPRDHLPREIQREAHTSRLSHSAGTQRRGRNRPGCQCPSRGG